MTEKKDYIATVQQVDAALDALKNIEEKPQVLNRGEVLKKFSDAIMRLHRGRHTVKEIVQLINASQGDNKFFSIKATEVKRIIAELSPVMEARRQSRKEYARKRKLASSVADTSIIEIEPAEEQQSISEIQNAVEIAVEINDSQQQPQMTSQEQRSRFLESVEAFYNNEHNQQK